MIIPGATEALDITIKGYNEELPPANLIFVTVSQGDQAILNKTGNALSVSGSVITMYLTQSESLRLQNLVNGRIQVNMLVPDGNGGYTRIPTIVAALDVGEQLLRRVLP